MKSPPLSAHYASRQPSAIRIASFRYAARRDPVEAVNVAIGNVSLPMHPAMIERMRAAGQPGKPFADGVVRYTATIGEDETRQAFLNIIASSGCDIDGLHCQITDGGSEAMELILVGLCGPAGSGEKPLMLIDAAYTNYKAFAARVGRSTVSICRNLDADGHFSLPSIDEIDRKIRNEDPGALVVIPYDNPTGNFYDQQTMVALARLCVDNNLWMVSDEAYRELFYTGGKSSSIWAIGEDEVPGITGRRISIETASKVWNACGLRVGALVTDNQELHTAAVAEKTASLCTSALGQHIFGALAHESHEALQGWYSQQRSYYGGMLESFTTNLRELIPGAIVSSPDASIYSVVDLRQVGGDGFDAMDFVLWCASEGKVALESGDHTLLTAPMAGFYSVDEGQPNPGRSQMRIAYVEPAERMALVPELMARLLDDYSRSR